MKLSPKKIAPILILLGVLVTTIWGFIGGWQYSWLAMFVAVILSGIVKILASDDKDDDF